MSRTLGQAGLYNCCQADIYWEKILTVRKMEKKVVIHLKKKLPYVSLQYLYRTNILCGKSHLIQQKD